MPSRIRIGRDGKIVMCGLLVVLVVILALLRQFSSQCFTYTYQVNDKRLSEFSVQNSEILRNEFGAARDSVRTAAAGFSQFDMVDSPESLELLGSIFTYSRFNRMWIADYEGTAYDSQGEKHDISRLPIFPHIAAGKTGVSDRLHSLYGGDDACYFYSPIPDKDNAIIGVYEIPSIIQNTLNRQFGGMGYIRVFEQDGTMILDTTSSDGGDSRVANIFTAFDSAKFDVEEDYDAFRKTLLSWKRGAIAYKLDGQKRLAYYEPLGVNDWYVMTVTPEKVARDASRPINDMAIGMVAKVFACFVALILGLLFFVSRSHKKIVHVNQQLAISNRRFRVAAFNISNSVIEYDVENRQLLKVVDQKEEQVIEAVETDLIPGQRIEEAELATLQEVLKKIEKDGVSESCVIRTKSEAGKAQWYKIVFTAIQNDEGKSVRAVGTVENVTRQVNTEIRYKIAENHRTAMTSKAMASFVFDLVHERDHWGNNSAAISVRVAKSTGDTRTLFGLIRKYVHPDHIDSLAGSLNPWVLQDRFNCGERAIERDFPTPATYAGKERWLRCQVNLVINPEDNHLMAYTYLEDITAAKLEELAIKNNAERDLLTGLYNRHTADSLISRHISRTIANSDSSTIDAFLLIDLDKFKEINDTFGHAAGDEVLQKLAEALRSTLRQSDIIGRMGGDEFMAFIKDSPDVDIIARKAADILAAISGIQITAAPHHLVSGSVGITLFQPGDDLKTLYHHADLALYASKGAGRNRFTFYDQEQEGGDA